MGKYNASKKKAGALRENEKAITQALVTDELLFARVDASLGQGGFRIVMNDGCITTAIPRGLFTSRSLRLTPGDIVILEDASSCKNYRIVGRIERKEARHFYQIGKICKHVWETPKDKKEEEEEDAFEFVEDDGKDDDAGSVDSYIDIKNI